VTLNQLKQLVAQAPPAPLDRGMRFLMLDAKGELVSVAAEECFEFVDAAAQPPQDEVIFDNRPRAHDPVFNADHKSAAGNFLRDADPKG
jgi:hypothetical protein